MECIYLYDSEDGFFKSVQKQDIIWDKTLRYFAKLMG